ncbi:MAG: RNase adapter RapZ [Gammaproteobacteria bacterium]|nr:RNase adapter RapZ [Gammaproteobacteria bacterium]NIM72202.1 RNase adapter RapZ [Gammaproteobacteria bacterium]NIN39117.1 RNase adapter RapZ [Gammaproteobacteria bacterium]NIO23950.1 RNase adapter RapZ [Gammaproteobacteria bacterium]NIO64602.1 RNase adapter RapZ [Gammaproteobacteria bacterium]
MKLIVISGLSGAGKSVALNVLEDLGYHCVDNLPLGLLEAFASELASAQPAPERVAAVIDARNLSVAFDRFPDIKAAIETRGVDCDVVFLEADDNAITKRFSETRRKHPLTAADVSLLEAIRRERTLLEPVRDLAETCIDTSHTLYHELRELIQERVVRRPPDTMSVQFVSFGYKHGIPLDADFVFDVRSLPNPYWKSELRQLNGRDQKVVAFLDAQPAVKEMLQSLGAFLAQWIPAFEKGNRAYLTVAVGCTGGNHRSVYVVEQLAAQFRESRDRVLVRHRDMS